MTNISYNIRHGSNLEPFYRQIFVYWCNQALAFVADSVGYSGCITMK